MKNNNLSLAMLTILLNSPYVMASANSGSQGYSGHNVTITTEGGQHRIDLRGYSGGDGDDGYDGSRGKCDTRVVDGRTVEDYEAGGDGQDGGDGGTGGNGGNLTVIYQDIQDVKNVLVYAPGGPGGDGGRGGRGGYGCPSGRDGRDGSSGSPGRIGTLSLIHKQYTPIQADTSSSYWPLEALVKPKTLVKQMWEKRMGAYELLSPNSIISSQYYFFLRYQEATTQIIFTHPEKISKHLLKETVPLFYSGSGPVEIQLNNSFYAIYKTKTDLSTFHDSTYYIDRLYLKNDLHRVGYEKVIGQKGHRQIVLKNPAPLIPTPQLKLHLRVEVRGKWFRYFDLFKGNVDESFISHDGQNYLIDLDRLPLSQAIISRAKLRLTLTYQLQEQTIITPKKSETWVVVVN
jgi:hypothetical protein